MNAVVITHYKENIDWVKNINPDVSIYVYSKSDTRFIYYPVIQGNDTNGYLKFIIDNYNKLPDKILFLHGHRNNWHQDYDADFICNHVNWELDDYFSVNKRETYQEISMISPPHARPYNLIKNYWNEIFGNEMILPDKFTMYGSSQFVVSKSLILHHSRDFYSKCLVWVNFAKDPINPAGNNPAHIFEWTWHYILTGKNIETQYKIDQVFNL
jgi:hypothetical protein